MTANGEVFDKNKLTCAHKKLPLETICRVTNNSNGRSVIVRVNDRGPYIPGRIIDLSYRAMKDLEGIEAGVIDVRVEIIELGSASTHEEKGSRDFKGALGAVCERTSLFLKNLLTKFKKAV